MALGPCARNEHTSARGMGLQFASRIFAEVVILAYQGWLTNILSFWKLFLLRVLISFALELVLSTTLSLLAYTRIRV